MNAAWTAGVVKHGNDPVKPSPGRVARISLHHFVDGEYMSTSEREWHGYTAADAIAEKERIFKGNRSDYERDGLTLIRRLTEGRVDQYVAEDLTEEAP